MPQLSEMTQPQEVAGYTKEFCWRTTCERSRTKRKQRRGTAATVKVVCPQVYVRANISQSSYMWTKGQSLLFFDVDIDLPINLFIITRNHTLILTGIVISSALGNVTINVATQPILGWGAEIPKCHPCMDKRCTNKTRMSYAHRSITMHR